jgi:F-type H+-transporting ATPase subunit beta
VAKQFTGLDGSYVKMEDTVRSFGLILDGKVDEIPEQCFRKEGARA